MSLGLSPSASTTTSNAVKQSTGPTAFGSVNIAPVIGAPGASTTYLWLSLAGLAAAIVFLFLKRK